MPFKCCVSRHPQNIRQPRNNRRPVNLLAKIHALESFRYRKTSSNHRAILHNLYSSGMAASKNAPPPSLTFDSSPDDGDVRLFHISVGSDWWIVFLTQKPECPSFDQKKPIAILIDRIFVDDESLLPSSELDTILMKIISRIHFNLTSSQPPFIR